MSAQAQDGDVKVGALNGDRHESDDTTNEPPLNTTKGASMDESSPPYPYNSIDTHTDQHKQPFGLDTKTLEPR